MYPPTATGKLVRWHVGDKLNAARREIIMPFENTFKLSDNSSRDITLNCTANMQGQAYMHIEALLVCRVSKI